MLGRIAAARFDFAGAVKYYSEAIDLEPTGSTHYAYRAAAHVELKDEEAAAADLAVVTRLTPRDDFPDRLRSVVHLNRGEYDRALAAADRALELVPWNPDGYLDRARLRHYRKEYRLSVSDYDECLRRTPDDASAHAGRVYSLIKLRDYDGAFRSAEASRGLLPSGPDGDTALAWLLATCPDESRRDPSRAVFHAQQACRRTFERGRMALQSLAAAHAARGAFAEAVHWQQKAMAAPGWPPRDELEHSTAILKLYQDGKPYRSP
jgi:tetratricopeptide (TPR) repeat protein